MAKEATGKPNNAAHGRARRPAGCDAIESIYDQHQALMRVYRSASSSHNSDRTVGGASASDLDLLRREFRFVRDEDEDAERGETDWRVRMSVRYYRKLFREYALADLSRYEEGRLGLRWRTEMEVVVGKGQFSCGNKRCDAAEDLRSYEVLFAYREHGEKEKRRCLVKLRVCPACARKLFFKKLQQRGEVDSDHRKRKRKGADAKQRSRKRRARRGTDSEDDSEGGSESDGEEEDVHRLCATINEQETREVKEQLTAGRGERRGPGDDDALKRLLP